MIYNNKEGNPHTFFIPNSVWQPIKKLSKFSHKTFQDIIQDAIIERTHKLLYNQNESLSFSKDVKQRTFRISSDKWMPFKSVCKERKLSLNKQFVIALQEYAKLLRKEYVDGL